MKSKSPEVMEYTGERMVPEKANVNTFWEHIYRYRFASQFVHNKRVLDIACGEGYGAAALLQAGARSVIGVDLSPRACEHARQKYGIDARPGDALAIPLPNQSIDAVVSFETIEHVDRPDQFLDECVRVLAPGGIAVISTPNRDAYREATGNNPYHLKELDEAEFTQLLKQRFSSIRIYSQCPRLAYWWSDRSFASDRSFWQFRGYWRIRKLLHWVICRELASQQLLEAARVNPVTAILHQPSKVGIFANPFYLRPRDESSGELPIYLVAVATL